MFLQVLKQIWRWQRAVLLPGTVWGLAICCASTAHAGDARDEHLKVFVTAYKSAVASVEGNTLIMRDGARLIIDDGQAKSHQQRLQGADIEDMLSQVYPLLACRAIDAKPVRNFDPGRIRNDRFFKAVYGGTAEAVRRDLVAVPWFGRTIQATRRMGVSEALKRVSEDLARLPDLDRRFVRRMGGTFNWRRIAGTARQSVHSFGAAIDVNTKYADYWRWSGGKPGNVPKYKNRIPENIVAAFERHGFIWGGRWYHYDTMHFEYRPALIAIAKLAAERGCTGIP